jgi:hypothetical protein
LLSAFVIVQILLQRRQETIGPKVRETGNGERRAILYASLFDHFIEPVKKFLALLRPFKRNGDPRDPERGTTGEKNQCEDKKNPVLFHLTDPQRKVLTSR